MRNTKRAGNRLFPKGGLKGACLDFGSLFTETLDSAGGLALFYVYLVTHRQGPSTSLALDSFSFGISFGTFSSLVNAFILFALFVAYLRKRFVPFGPWYFAFTGLCLGAGNLIGYAVETMPAIEPAFSLLAALYSLFTNVGMAFLSLEWIRLLGSLGSRRTVAVLISSSIIAACFFMALPATSLLSLPAITLVFPLGSLFVLVRYWHRHKKLRSRKTAEYGSQSKLNIPYRLLATVFVSDFVCAVVFALLQFKDLGFGLQANGVCYAGAALLLFVLAICLRFDFNSLIYRVAFVAMASGCALLAMPAGFLAASGVYLNQMGYRFMLALVWLLSVWLIEQRALSANWVFPVVTGVAFLGQFGGSAFASQAIMLLGETSGMLVACLAMTLALPVSALYLFDIHNLQTGWGFSSPIDGKALAGDRIDLACDELARQFCLTAREAEVFALRAKGHSRSSIGERLVLSVETVKSYANKMYAKVDVHSKQELVELVDKKMSEFEVASDTLPRTIL